MDLEQFTKLVTIPEPYIKYQKEIQAAFVAALKSV